MATLLELIIKGELEKFDPVLDPDQAERRWFYLTPRLKQLFTDTLPSMESTWKIEMTPLRQVDDLLQAFTSGEPLTYPTGFHELRHRSQFVWELKTGDVRIFGWFPQRDHFIGHSMEWKERLRESPGLYHGYANEIAHFVGKLNLNEPKFIAGADPRHVLSTFDFAP